MSSTYTAVPSKARARWTTTSPAPVYGVPVYAVLPLSEPELAQVCLQRSGPRYHWQLGRCHGHQGAVDGSDSLNPLRILCGTHTATTPPPLPQYIYTVHKWHQASPGNGLGWQRSHPVILNCDWLSAQSKVGLINQTSQKPREELDVVT